MQVVKYSDRKALAGVLERSSVDYSKVAKVVSPILDDVRRGGDKALYKYTRKFDKFDLSGKNLEVSRGEIRRAYSRVDSKLVKSLKHARRNIAKFHREQYKNIRKQWMTSIEHGVKVGERLTPIDSVGCYVPGGLASYPSTVLMTVLPARVAGVKRVVVVSPPPISDAIMVACDLCGVDEVYGVGGAQAVAALAYGTESIGKVSKIVGPGNKYVMAAKNMVYGLVDIDMPAGPSEVLIIGDKTTDPVYAASDLLAQAEHDPDASSVLVTSSPELVKSVRREVGKQAKSLGRRKVLRKSIKNITFVLTKSLRESLRFADEYAAEHLQVMTRDPGKDAARVKNAGAIFIGPYSPVPAGDYCSGGNHVLPTSGAAKYSSVLNVRDYLKVSSVQEISKAGLKRLAGSIKEIADAEGFDAHSRAVRKRLE